MITVIVPIYNEEGSIVELCERINEAIKDYSSDYEIMLI